MKMCSNNFFVKHAYYFKLVVSTFAFKPKLSIMFKEPVFYYKVNII